MRLESNKDSCEGDLQSLNIVEEFPPHYLDEFWPDS